MILTVSHSVHYKEKVGAPREQIECDNHVLFEIGIIKNERLEIELIPQAILHLKPTPSLQEQVKEIHDNANDDFWKYRTYSFYHSEIGKS